MADDDRIPDSPDSPDDERFDALRGLLEPPPISPPTADEVESALARVMARRDEPERGAVIAFPDQRRWSALGVRAAAALLVVAAGALVWRGFIYPPAAGVDTPPARELVTGAGSVDSIRLADGSTVILAPESRLRIDAGYGRRARVATLEGRALFTVAHDASRPFEVRTATALLRDVGTAFVVTARDTSGTELLVTDGVVSARRLQARDGGAVLVRAGERAQLPIAGSVIVSRGADTAEALAFTRGALVFRDATIADVAGELRRWHGVELRVNDPALAARRVTASFSRESPADIGRVLAAAVGGTARLAGDTIFIAPASGGPGRR